MTETPTASSGPMRNIVFRGVISLAFALLAVLSSPTGAEGSAVEQTPASAPVPDVKTDPAVVTLNPTAHPPVPPTLDAMWLAPAGNPSSPPVAIANLARAIALLEESGNPAEALSLISLAALAKTPVNGHARYYSGLAHHRLNRLDEAETAYAAVVASNLDSQLTEAAFFRRAEIRETRRDFAGATAIYRDLLVRKAAFPQTVLLKLGAVASAAGDRQTALYALQRVLREFPLSAEVTEADKLVEQMGAFRFETAAAVTEELTRGDGLFAARRYDLAKTVYQRLRSHASGEEGHRVTMRLAQIQAAEGQHRAAREVFRRYATHPTLGVDARFGLLSAERASGNHGEARSQTKDFVARYPAHRYAEEAMNEVARRYVLDDDDDDAAEAYTEMIDRFPKGVFAERGAWKAGWWAYREKNFAETLRIFERAASLFPRSDYRPSWLYWTARVYEQTGDLVKAAERYRLTVGDYANTYYGRLAQARLTSRSLPSATPNIRRAATDVTPPANAEIVRLLIGYEMYRPALNELQYAQRVWGDSPPLQASIALVHNRMGNLRPGINAMRRAYPQFMAAGGEELPPEILRVIYPLDYWPLLKGNAQVHGLDPFIVAALAAQESTFDAQIRSPANAIGLMQIITPTGRRVARQIGMRNFSERSLENPEINARLGAQYFGDMVKRFGGYHFALAGYNAGEQRVVRWNEEAPGVPQDEWIDNIPFAETQNYVKRILGTAEDYRRLYNENGQPRQVTAPTSAAKSATPAVKSAPKSPAKTAKPTPKTAKPPARTTKKPATKKPPAPAGAKPRAGVERRG